MLLIYFLFLFVYRYTWAPICGITLLPAEVDVCLWKTQLPFWAVTALKFSEAFQKDLAARAMNVDQNFWSRYAAAITNGLAMRNNEISVIQSGGVPQLPVITVVTDKASTGNSPPITAMEKTGLERGAGQHFSMMIDDKKTLESIKVNVTYSFFLHKEHWKCKCVLIF